MAGSDPTLNTLIEFNAPLPGAELYCPDYPVQFTTILQWALISH